MKISPKNLITKGEKRTARFATERIKNFNPETNRASFAISSKSVDHYGEIVLPTAVLTSWDEHYKRNPVFLWGHLRSHPDYYIGTCKNIWIHEDGRPSAEFEFDTEDEFAAKCARKVQKDIIRMTSIGFLPLEWVSKWDDDDKKRTLPDFAFKALEGGECWVVFTKIRLLEVSLVGIGANPDADNHNREIEEFIAKHFGVSRPEFEKYLEEVDVKNQSSEEKTKDARAKFRALAKAAAETAKSGEEDVEPVEDSSEADDDEPTAPPGDSEKSLNETEQLKARVDALEKSLEEAIECLTHLMEKDISAG